MAHLFGSLSVLTILAVVFVPYWIPTIVAFVRHVDRKAGIVLLNVFAGWTVIGWVAALIWHSSQKRRSRRASAKLLTPAWLACNIPPSKADSAIRCL